eukprot:4529764-Pyramimonas_sp.AAC.1
MRNRALQASGHAGSPRARNRIGPAGRTRHRAGSIGSKRTPQGFASALLQPQVAERVDATGGAGR